MLIDGEIAAFAATAKPAEARAFYEGVPGDKAFGDSRSLGCSRLACCGYASPYS